MLSQPALAAQASGLGLASPPPIPWLRIGLSLLFCLGLTALAILALRHRQGRVNLATLAKGLPGLAQARHARIEVIETRRVSPHGDVCLLHCEGQSYLIAVGQGQMLLLDKQPVPAGEDAR